jgi:hypothetical protein
MRRPRRWAVLASRRTLLTLAAGVVLGFCGALASGGWLTARWSLRARAHQALA